MPASPKKIEVFYDGLCVVCSAEIEHYKKLKGSENISFVDIANPEFDPAKENLDPHKINVELHARDAQGQLHIGVDAFILIWSQLEKLQWLHRIATKNSVKKFLQFNYQVFVKVRPFLPRKSCETSPYCDLGPSK